MAAVTEKQLLGSPLLPLTGGLLHGAFLRHGLCLHGVREGETKSLNRLMNTLEPEVASIVLATKLEK